MAARRRFGFVLIPFLAVSFGASALQRTSPRPARDLQELAAGWTALATGRAAEAERIGDALVQASPRSHDAVALQIRARVARGGATAGLDAYEAWLPGVRQREDAFLLEQVALSRVQALSAAADGAIRSRALEVLAATGDKAAVDQLNAMNASGSNDGLTADLALVRLGDSSAAQRVVGRVKSAGTRDVSTAIDVLRERGVKGVTDVIASALDRARPLPTRMAAARALAELGDPAAVPRLKEALQDPDPPVRIVVAAALARLGDDSGAEIMRTLANSPVGDFRLLAAEAHAQGNPTGPWVAVATGVLQDADPLVRLRAAELLLEHAADHGAARDLLVGALTDANPAMQSAAAQVLARVGSRTLEGDLPTLRKLLRDSSPLLQIEASNAILRVAGAIQP